MRLNELAYHGTALAWHFGQNFSGYADRRHFRGDIADDQRIRSNECVITNLYCPEDLCSGSNIHVTANHRNARAAASNCYLLEDQAIHPDRCVRVDHDAIRMRNKQAPSYARIELDSGAAHHGPETVFQDKPFADTKGNYALLLAPMLITPDRQQQLAARIPEPLGFLTAPIGNLGADEFLNPDFFFLRR